MHPAGSTSCAWALRIVALKASGRPRRPTDRSSHGETSTIPSCGRGVVVQTGGDPFVVHEADRPASTRCAGEAYRLVALDLSTGRESKVGRARKRGWILLPGSSYRTTGSACSCHRRHSFSALAANHHRPAVPFSWHCPGDHSRARRQSCRLSSPSGRHAVTRTFSDTRTFTA